MRETTLLLPGLSPVSGKAVEACFDGGSLSSDAGVLALREIAGKLKVAERLTACIADPRQPERVRHSLTHIIRFRLLMIACGYEDGIDADSLRGDPAFKMALGRLPSAADLCSQSTISRLENRPDARALVRMGRAMVDLYCASFRQGATAHRAGHRRHVRRRPWPAAAWSLQRPLRRARLPAHRRIFDGDGRFVAAVLRPPGARAAERSRATCAV
jgi:hypothetical protein